MLGAQEEGEKPPDLGKALRGAVEGTAVLVAVAFAQHLQKQRQRMEGKGAYGAIRKPGWSGCPGAADSLCGGGGGGGGDQSRGQ